MSERKEIVAKHDQGEYSIMLPCSQDEFGEFISSLLGKPQTINRYYGGVFQIKKDDLVNIFHLVDQRINQQNESKLIQFTATINYDDDSSVTITSLEDFENYSEIAPHSSTGVMMTWVYLIKFHNRRVPEKQEIEVRFNTGKYYSKSYLVAPGDTISFRDSPFSGHFRINIRHTARSWGVDLEGLLFNHIRGLEIKQHKFEEWIWKHSGGLGFFAGLSFFLLSMIGAYYVMYSFAGQRSGAALKAIQTFSSIDDKIEFLLQSVLVGAWPKFILSLILFSIVCLILAIVVGIIVDYFAYNRPESHLLLTKESKDSLDRENKRRKYALPKFFFGVIIAVITGLCANYIFLVATT